jgi:predicted dehydrogenase
MASVPQIAIIGCGAIADQYYLPALAAEPRLRAATWIVDPSAERRAEMCRKFGIPSNQQLASAEDLDPSVHIAVNATPSHMHVATTLPLIERGINVIVEKPLAEFSDQALGLVEAAAGRCLLSVNQYRRLVPSYAMVRELLRSGEIGEVRSVKWSEGRKFDWPTHSGFYFRRPWGTHRPRGALLDIGVHVLDQICWWLEDAPYPVTVAMDGYGGPEACVSARLKTRTATIELAISFHSKLSNTFVVEGSNGAIRGSTVDYERVERRSKGGDRREVAIARSPSNSLMWSSVILRTLPIRFSHTSTRYRDAVI